MHSCRTCISLKVHLHITNLCGYNLALPLDRQGGRHIYAAEPTRQMTDRHMSAEQWMNGQMDKWKGEDEVFVRETNSCFHLKAEV